MGTEGWVVRNGLENRRGTDDVMTDKPGPHQTGTEVNFCFSLLFPNLCTFLLLGYVACVLYDQILYPYLVSFIDLKQLLYLLLLCNVCVCAFERGWVHASHIVCKTVRGQLWGVDSFLLLRVLWNKFMDVFRFALCAQRDYTHWIIPHVPLMFLNPDISESSPMNINSSQQCKLSSLGT